MAKPLDNLLSRIRGGNKKPSPTKTIGVPGTAIWGGYIQEKELNSALTGSEKYTTYSEILANTSIVAAGTRYFLNLVAKADWTFTPSEADTDGQWAELAEEMLTDDPATPWHRIVRRAAMYRFYGFSIQEWTARRRDDGKLTFADVAPRAQLTIEKWDTDVEGNVLGAIQRSPQSMKELYLPRQKLLYMVDDTLSDSPEGLGLFRHLVAPSQRLARYEQLEGFGFETDLRGIPIGRGPFTELQEQVEDGTISKEQRVQIEKAMRTFIQNHIKTQSLGLLLDSAVYTSEDDKETPSSQKMWDIELLKGSATSFAENASAIERLNREMARILGVEQLMLGSDSTGSFALSQDKTNSFFLLVDGTLTEVEASVKDDLLTTLWKLNGFPEEMMPTAGTEAVRHTDVAEVTASLRDMATAGATLDERDPAIETVREMLGLPARPPELLMEAEEDAALVGDTAGTDGDGQPVEGSTDGEEELPEDETQQGRE